MFVRHRGSHLGFVLAALTLSTTPAARAASDPAALRCIEDFIAGEVDVLSANDLTKIAELHPSDLVGTIERHCYGPVATSPSAPSRLLRVYAELADLHRVDGVRVVQTRTTTREASTDALEGAPQRRSA